MRFARIREGFSGVLLSGGRHVVVFSVPVLQGLAARGREGEGSRSIGTVDVITYPICSCSVLEMRDISWFLFLVS